MSKVSIATILSGSVTLGVHGAGIRDSSSEITKSSQDALASLYPSIEGDIGGVFGRSQIFGVHSR